jgi:hypothetical protein
MHVFASVLAMTVSTACKRAESDGKRAEGSSCERDAECPGELLCFNSRCTDHAAATTACRVRVSCKNVGACTASQKAKSNGHSSCVAEADQDCRRSELCRKIGRCTPKEGLCVALSNEHCRKSEMCAAMGLCTARDGVCLAASDRDCRGSKSCKQWKQCMAWHGECASAPAD